MATYKRFEDLPIWQDARVFAKQVFEASKKGEFSKDLQNTEIKGLKYKKPEKS